MKRSILLLGNPKSIFIKQSILNVLKEIDLDIYVGGNTNLNKEDKEFYKNNNVEYINLFEVRGAYKYLPKIGVLFSYFHNIRKIAKNKKFDFLQIHYVGNQRFTKYTYRIYKMISHKLIITFWGSDILDIDEKKAKYIKGLVKQADTIVLPTAQMKFMFEKYYGEEFSYKIKHCIFGNPVVQTYIENKSELSDIEKYMPVELPKNKKIISVGYNGLPRQNHIKIIEAISTLPSKIKDNIIVLIQAGYGGNSEYINEIKNCFDTLNINGIVLENFIGMKETIALKKRVDIFIHGQKTDALSASLIEYILMDTFVLNPKWIQYNELKELGINYIEYQHFSDIKEILINIFENKIEKGQYDKVIEENFSWSARKKEWKSLYE